MGRAKHIFMEIEHAKQIIDSIYEYLKNGVSTSIKNKHFQILKYLSSELNNNYIRELVFENLEPFQKELSEKGLNNNDPSFVINLLETLIHLKYKIDFPEHFSNNNNILNNSINSESYYSEKIKELQIRENELNEILRSNNNQTKEQKKIAEQTVEKLKAIEIELNKKKKELEVKQKQEDAKSDWEQKINDTFTQLKKYLDPIKQEHNRLNILYYAFAGLSIVTIIIISIIEINAVYKLASNEDFPNFKQYLMLFLPLPIAGALMWGFVFQMNRAQRQLILIANNIHSINYIQGLLISINNLSPNINDGILRINNALDKIISNHLKNKSVTSESELLKEENKDENSNIDIDKLMKLIKTVKETVK